MPERASDLLLAGLRMRTRVIRGLVMGAYVYSRNGCTAGQSVGSMVVRICVVDSLEHGDSPGCSDR